MKTELNKIAKDLEQGTITDNEARTLLLGLLIVSESTLDANGLMVVEGGYGYYKLYQNKEYLMEGELLECHKRAREIMKQLEYKTIGGVLLRLCGVVKRLRLKYLKWRAMDEIRQLDFDMQCTNTTYKQYEVEYNRLSKQYDNLQ